ncbi:MAG: hypothetical protein U0625_11845 [Phycisphaerales bacterium]
MGDWSTIAAAAAASMAASAAATGLLRRALVRMAVVDHANERSSHVGSVPRGGGVAFVAVGMAACAACVAAMPGALAGGGAAGAGAPWAIAAAGAAIAVVGAVDDARGLGARPRLAVHLLAAAALAWAALPLPALALPGGGALELGWLAWPLVVLAAAWSVNLTNFMDGIDGIAASHGAAVLGFFAACAGVHGEATLAACCAALAGAVAGFLPWNLSRRGRIFMGDAGSGFLGFALAAAALLCWRAEAVTGWTALAAGASFVVDASLTLLRRAARRQRLSQPHREHAYQRLADRMRSHRRATALYIAADLLWTLPLAAAATAWPQHGAALAAAAYAPLLVVAWIAGAGAPQASGAETR